MWSPFLHYFLSKTRFSGPKAFYRKFLIQNSRNGTLTCGAYYYYYYAVGASTWISNINIEIETRAFKNCHFLCSFSGKKMQKKKHIQFRQILMGIYRPSPSREKRLTVSLKTYFIFIDFFPRISTCLYFQVFFCIREDISIFSCIRKMWIIIWVWIFETIRMTCMTSNVCIYFDEERQNDSIFLIHERRNGHRPLLFSTDSPPRRRQIQREWNFDIM